jgi:hypothetical protein
MILREHFPLRLRRFGLFATLLLALTSLPVWAQKAPPEPPEHTTITANGTFSGVNYTTTWQFTAPLPPQAATLLDQFKKQQEAARQAVQAVIAELKMMEAFAARNNSLDEARALRRAIHDLQPAPSADQPLSDPGALTEYRGQIGKSYRFEVTGVTVKGPPVDSSLPHPPIWGSGIYTDDSTLAAAAVHAGVLKPGEKGIVRVTIQPGLAAYEGSVQNGVESESYGLWAGSYTVGPYRARISSTRIDRPIEAIWRFGPSITATPP